MKKGLEATLYLPLYYVDVLKENEENINKHIQSYSSECQYEIYIGEYSKNELCIINIEFRHKTKETIKQEYKDFKKFIKEIADVGTTELIVKNFDIL